MASTMRSLDTRFWSDVWVRKLNALDRYMFLYFLTNQHSTWCGVYEIDLSMVAFESGIDEYDLKKVILPRLSPKILYVDGWIYIANFEKYHANRSEKTKKGIDVAWEAVPERIRLKIKELGNYIPEVEKINLPSQNLPRRYALLIRDRFICRYCDKIITIDSDYEVDHIIPVSKGGNDGYENTVVSCRNCNQKKGDTDIKLFTMRKIIGKPYHIEKAIKELQEDENMAKMLKQVYPSYSIVNNQRGVSPSSLSSASSLSSL